MSEARSSLSLVAGMQVTPNVALIKPLGAGGMGAVWLADHHSLKTQVVVKFMLGGLDSSANARLRFSREAMAAAQVKSPHVVQMLDHGVTDDGVPFIVMEHLEGHDLGVEIERHGPVAPAKVILIVHQIAKALSKVHSAGLLHRDIKPDNIFLCAHDDDEDVFVKLLDFGIAKSNAGEAGRDGGTLDGETKTGQVVGTPYYMSPEQVTASKVLDFRSDLWALGVVAYEALTGVRPFDGPSFGALAVKIATGSPPKPSEANASLPPSIDAWFAKACARDPQARFGSAKELAEGLRAVFEGVVSLPAGAMSDSGRRRYGSTPDPDNAGSGPRETAPSSRTPSPTFGLGATLEDPKTSDPAVLARSVAGSSSVIDRKPGRSSSAMLFIGGALLMLLGVGAFFAMNGSKLNPAVRPSADVPTKPIAPPATPARIPVASSVPAAPASVATEEPKILQEAGAPPSVSAHPAAKVIPPPPPTHVPPPQASKTLPSSEPTAKPPVPKPSSSEPDLY